MNEQQLIELLESSGSYLESWKKPHADNEVIKPTHLFHYRDGFRIGRFATPTRPRRGPERTKEIYRGAHP